jgi:chromosome segregation ATPase
MDDPNMDDALRALEAALDEERTTLLASHDDLNDKIAHAREILRTCAAQLERQRPALDGLGAPARTAAGRIRELAQTPRIDPETQKRIRTLEAALEKQREETAAATAKLNILENALKAREEELAALSERGGEAETLKKEIDDLHAKLRAADHDREQALGEARAALSKAQGIESKLREEADAARAELETTRKNLRGMEDRIKAEADQLRTTQEELEAARARHTALEAERDTLRTALNEAESLREELDRLRTQLEDSDAARGALAAEQEALRSEAERLRAEMKQMVAPETVAAVQQELAALRTRLADAEAELASERARGTRAQLAAQLAEALKEAEDLKEELRRLRASNATAPATPTVGPGSTAAAEDEQVARVLAAAKRARNGLKRTVGELLVEAGIVTPAQIHEAIEIQRRSPQKHIGAILIEKQYASEAAVAQALAAQCGVDFIRITADTIEPEAAALINERLAAQHKCIPIRATESAVVLAMANPLDLVAIEDIERSTGKSVEFVVSTAQDIRGAINRTYAA